MFWYFFIIALCGLLIAGVLILRKWNKNAAELTAVRVEFDARGQAANASLNGPAAEAGEARASGSDANNSASGGNVNFCFISDIHISCMPVPWSQILDTLRELQPAFVLIGGDLVNKADDTGPAVQFVYTLSSGLGVPVLIVPGNHDNEVAAEYPGGRDAFFGEFTRLPGDVRVIDDSMTVAAGVLIGGLRDKQTRSGAPDGLIAGWSETAAKQGLKFICTTHNADILLEGRNASALPSGAPACVLCGHTHGGQVRLFSGIEFSLLKSDQLPRRGIFYGTAEVNGYPVLITSGLGCALMPIRSGTRPELVEVVLRG